MGLTWAPQKYEKYLRWCSEKTSGPICDPSLQGVSCSPVFSLKYIKSKVQRWTHQVISIREKIIHGLRWWGPGDHGVLPLHPGCWLALKLKDFLLNLPEPKNSGCHPGGWLLHVGTMHTGKQWEMGNRFGHSYRSCGLCCLLSFVEPIVPLYKPNKKSQACVRAFGWLHIGNNPSTGDPYLASEFHRAAIGISCKMLGPPFEGAGTWIAWFEQRKNSLLLSIESWLVNRDPYSGVL